MNTLKHTDPKHCLFVVFFVIAAVAFTSAFALAEQKLDVEEGYYYIKATNGNANGKVLYWDEKAKDQNICMMFESAGGSHAENEVWLIRPNRSREGCLGIYLARTYTGNLDKNKRLEIDNLTGRDQPYLMSTKGPHVFCGPFSNQDDGFNFYCQDKTSSYTNLVIRSHDDNYKLNRHKVVKPFKADLLYVNANKDKDNKNKLWELIPVNYSRGFSKAAPSVTAKKDGNLQIKWKKLRDKYKDSKIWKNAKYVEIQWSTDKNFSKNVKSKKIKKGSVNKEKAKSTLANLKPKKTYYVHARLIDAKGVGSNWSKTVEARTRK